METAKSSSSLLLKLAIVFFVFSLVTTLTVVGLLVTKSTGKTCNYNGTIYSDGEGFMDDCNSCSCQNGDIACTTMACEAEYDDIFYPESDYLDDEVEVDDEYPEVTETP
jgi:hypothetical protein